ncbi:MAG: hypothetical protein HY553_19435 [Elusimicrobia bacterium]|nr:hypothetical protein [Elusimicrobiota bacterium]
MQALALLSVLLTAVAVAAAAVTTFSAAIDGVIGRIVEGEFSKAWSKYAKFAVFVASLAGGLRVRELEAWTRTPVDSGRLVLEVLKTAMGCGLGASWTLLAVFGAAFSAFLGMRLYERWRPAAAPRADERERAAGRL